jgi:hypothetical protein
VDDIAAATLAPFSYRRSMHCLFHLAQMDCQAMAALHKGATVFQPDFLRIEIVARG